MTDNCTVTAVTAPGLPDKSGKITFPAATAIAARATFAEPATGQRIAQQQLYANASGVLRVFKSQLPPGVALRPGYAVRLVLDGGTVQTLVVTSVKDWVKGALSHYEAVLEDRK